MKASCSLMFHISQLQSVSLHLHTLTAGTLNIFPFRNQALHKMILYKLYSRLKKIKYIRFLYSVCLEELPIIQMLQLFRNNLTDPLVEGIKGERTLENLTDKMSWNIGNELPFSFKKPFKVKTLDCFETSIKISQCSLHNNPEARSSPVCSICSD